MQARAGRGGGRAHLRGDVDLHAQKACQKVDRAKVQRLSALTSRGTCRGGGTGRFRGLAAGGPRTLLVDTHRYFYIVMGRSLDDTITSSDRCGDYAPNQHGSEQSRAWAARVGFRRRVHKNEGKKGPV